MKKKPWQPTERRIDVWDILALIDDMKLPPKTSAYAHAYRMTLLSTREMFHGYVTMGGMEAPAIDFLRPKNEILAILQSAQRFHLGMLAEETSGRSRDMEQGMADAYGKVAECIRRSL